MVMVRGLGSLEVFLETEEGAAFITDNEMFMTCVTDRACTLLYTSDYKDPGCKFQLSLVPSGKVLLQDFRGLYMSAFPPNGIGFLEPSCPAEDVLCEFEPFYEDDKVALRAPNGMFLCRLYRRYHYIEPSRPNPDQCCRFRLVIGDMLVPSFEITELEFVSPAKVKVQPCIVKKEVFVNNTDVPQDHVFTLSWEDKTVETTTWSRAWGMDHKCTFNFNLLAIEATVSYNGTYQKMATYRHTIRESRTVTVTVLPHMQATAHLVVSKQEEVEVPFEAHIKKLRADGNTVLRTEPGKWRGMVYDEITVEVKQEAPKRDTPCRIM